MTGPAPIHSDTIAALATPPGAGAVSIIRLSGPAATSIAASLWHGRQSLDGVPARVVTRGTVTDADGHPLDDALAVRFPAPASFTGEDVVEFHTHGSPAVTAFLLDALARRGARPAAPGEFSQRAFLNGKLDLAQAEAIMDTIAARSRLALHAAHQQWRGNLSTAIEALRTDLIGILAHLEAWIDFPDEDIDPDTGASLTLRIESLLGSIRRLLTTAQRGRILRQGLRVVLTGLPNAGKSSLLNQILGFDRAIVSPEPGTTRDTVEESIELEGIPVRLVDTAGLRDPASPVEAQGIDRTHQAVAAADIILEVIDATLPPHRSPAEPEPARAPRLIVLNKADLGPHPAWPTPPEPDTHLVSCRTGDGLPALVRALTASAAVPLAESADLVAINARHQSELEAAARSLETALPLLAQGAPPELPAEDLRAAAQHLGNITGAIDTEDILDAIFARFCIGK